MPDEIDLPSGWNDWQITEIIGEGSFGVVYKACKELSGETLDCAIKVIELPQENSDMGQLGDTYKNKESLRNFYKKLLDEYMAEIGAMAKLKGISNIVSIEDALVTEKEEGFGWNIYIRMELLESFTDYRMKTELSQEEIVKLGIDICSALSYCERAGIIHRDIKPENVFRSAMGEYKLGDFGIAGKIEHLSEHAEYADVRGTDRYMAPEVYLGKSFDYRADIYSLGLMLYIMMNNNRDPFTDPEKSILNVEEQKKASIRRFAGEKMPAPVKADEAFARIILKACEYDPKNRYHSAQDMKKALLKLQENASTPQPIAPTSLRRRILKYGAMCASLLAGVIFMNAGLSNHQQETDEQNAAEAVTEIGGPLLSAGDTAATDGNATDGKGADGKGTDTSGKAGAEQTEPAEGKKKRAASNVSGAHVRSGVEHGKPMRDYNYSGSQGERNGIVIRYISPSVQSRTDSKTGSSLNTEGRAEEGRKTGFGVSVKEQAQTEVQTEIQSEVQSEIQSEVQSEAKTEAESQAQAETEYQPETQAEDEYQPIEWDKPEWDTEYYETQFAIKELAYIDDGTYRLTLYYFNNTEEMAAISSFSFDLYGYDAESEEILHVSNIGYAGEEFVMEAGEYGMFTVGISPEEYSEFGLIDNCAIETNVRTGAENVTSGVGSGNSGFLIDGDAPTISSSENIPYTYDEDNEDTEEIPIIDQTYEEDNGEASDDVIPEEDELNGEAWEENTES